MARYIDADNVKLKGICVFDQNLEILVPLSDVRKALQMTPTADVQEVRNGKWLPIKAWFDDDYSIESDNERYQTSWKCSLCGRIELIKEPYCHCGAKMDLEE